MMISRIATSKIPYNYWSLVDLLVRKFGYFLEGSVVEIRFVIQQTRTTLVCCVTANTSFRNTTCRLC
jgi:hypothetical protein